MRLRYLKSEESAIAVAKWKEYAKAEKEQKTRPYGQKNPMYKELKKLYFQMKSGRKLIDIRTVINNGGVSRWEDNHPPRMAIVPLWAKQVACHYYMNGSVRYTPSQNEKLTGKPVELPKGTLATYTWKDGNNWRWQTLYAPVPLVPPHLKPKVITDDMYILWEVEHWSNIAPGDPWLLRKITDWIYVVLAGWDLTDLERRLMNEHLVKQTYSPLNPLSI